MKQSALSVLEFILLAVLLGGCATATTLIPSNTASPTATLAPSNTPKPTSTPTPAPTQTQSITRTPSGPFPVGKYKHEDGGLVFFFKFLPDGTYAVTGGGMGSSGTYVVADDQIEFTELSPPDCGQSTYLWSFDGTELTLMRVQDPCGWHEGIWTGHPWTIQP